jgi:hypothetical protein
MHSRLWLLTTLVAAVFLWPAAADADEWNDRTTLTFSAPVMVPGATLPAGTYIFELADARGNRHLVRIRSQATNDVSATVQAVPIRRAEASGDTILQFNPTDTGAAPAIKAWFYPGSRYGHEFVYPEEQARHIADRTKTVVLSVDVPGTDLEQGVLRTYSASGQRAAWRGDDETMREWDAWQRTRQSDNTAEERRQATAPAVRADFEGMRVALDALEDNPAKYIGQRISVDAEVEDVHGPRLFTIDEPNWGDLDGEVLVLMRTPLAALVKEGDRVTISGTMRPFVRTEIEREWGWLGLDPEIEVEVGAKPVLVAKRLIGGDNNVAMVIDTTVRADQPIGTSGSATPMTDARAIGNGNESLVGRRVGLNNIRVTGTATGGGFFVSAGDRHLFVLPAMTGTMAATGDTVTIEGTLLQMPRSMVSRLNAPGSLNDDLYLYATTVRR